MFTKILVPVDIDIPKTAEAVYKRAAEIAEPSGALIRLVGVLPGFGMPIVASFISDEMRKEIAHRMKDSIEAFINTHCAESVTYEVRTGKNWEEIIRSADTWGADLIVVYYDRRNDITEVHSGTCARRVMEHADCSVLWLRKIPV